MQIVQKSLKKFEKVRFGEHLWFLEFFDISCGGKHG